MEVTLRHRDGREEKYKEAVYVMETEDNTIRVMFKLEGHDYNAIDEYDSLDWRVVSVFGNTIPTEE